MIRIALVDDHQLFRKSLCMLLATFEEVEVVFDTDDGSKLFEKLDEGAEIDVVLLDIQMPIMDGFEICTRLKRLHPDVKILIVSQLTTKEAVHKIMDCGANGFYTKNSPPEVLEDAIKGVLLRDYYFDIELADVIREAILWEKKVYPNFSFSQKVTLTNREVEIIVMACKEMSSIQIGDKLCISTRTVEKHRRRIMEKTDSKNFIGVVLYALKCNAIYLEDL
ncbi:MAG: response regulator transcription factor [Flavobacterium sp.]|nr:response regulator transcription factor [Flavobacterium sp.]